jgi:hypothetical protein
MHDSRFAAATQNWRTHLAESYPKIGSFYGVEKAEEDDGIHVHRASVRYWYLKSGDPNFHADSVGGRRNFCFAKWEFPVCTNVV